MAQLEPTTLDELLSAIIERADLPEVVDKIISGLMHQVRFYRDVRDQGGADEAFLFGIKMALGVILDIDPEEIDETVTRLAAIVDLIFEGVEN